MHIQLLNGKENMDDVNCTNNTNEYSVSLTVNLLGITAVTG